VSFCHLAKNPLTLCIAVRDYQNSQHHFWQSVIFQIPICRSHFSCQWPLDINSFLLFNFFKVFKLRSTNLRLQYIHVFIHISIKNSWKFIDKKTCCWRMMPCWLMRCWLLQHVSKHHVWMETCVPCSHMLQ
jgi:hypothetical protein